MKKNVKRNLLALSASICCAALGGVFALTAQPVSAAAAAEDFALQAGASVRIKGDNVSGIRFKATVKESYIQSLSANGEKVEYLALIAPSANVDDITKLTVENRTTYDAVSIISTSTPAFTDENVDETFTYYAAITYDNTELAETELLQSYGVDLVARPYIAVTNKDGEQSYVYADTTAGNARSMSTVANLALEDMANGKQIVEGKLSDAQFNSLVNYCEQTETKAVLENSATDVEFIDGTAYNGAKVYMKDTDEEKGVVLAQVGTVANKKLDVSNVAIDESLTVGETENLFLVNGDGLLTTSYRKITQIIDTAQELRIFDQGSYANGYALVEGYYVLGKNIVDTEYSYNTTSLISHASDATLKDTWYSDYGFKGTFDGMGHYVSIKSGAGLFNQVLPMNLETGECSVIKNVAFKDCKIATTNIGSGAGQYVNTSLLGHGGNLYNLSAYKSARDKLMVKVSDVYIWMGEDYFNLPRHDNMGSVTAALISDDMNNVSYKNVVVEIADPPTTHTASPNLFRTSTASKMYDERFSNVYVIGKTTDASVYGAETQVTNKTFTSQLKLTKILSGIDRNANTGAVTTTSPTTIGLYKDNADWKTAVTDLETRFDSDCWTMQDGVPVWSAFIDNSVKIAKNIVFSGWTGAEVDNDEVKDQTIVCNEIEGTISAVYLVSDIMQTNNLYNAVTGKVAITNDTNEPLKQEVYIVTDKTQYRATLEVYTRVLTSAADLRMFNQTADDYRVITGCYALGDDIVDTEFTYGETIVATSVTNWYTYGFGGTFDGKGHYITYTCGQYGLFGQFAPGAVVKNVAFNDVVLEVAANKAGLLLARGLNLGYLTVANSGYNGYNDICVSISNVYISVGASWFDRYAERGTGAQDINKDGDKEDIVDGIYEEAIGAGEYATHVKGRTNATGILPGPCSSIDYKNVIIQINAPDTYTYAPDLFREGYYKKDGASKAGFENVYVIGKSVGPLVNEGLGIVGKSAVENTTNFYSWYAGNAYYWNPPTTVGFYTDATAWKTAVSDLATKFTSSYWTMQDGVPVWSALAK